MIHNRGDSGCSSSHIKLWKYIHENELDWILILEDDANFHPNFKDIFYRYWNDVPQDAYIVYPGHDGTGKIDFPFIKTVLNKSPMCCCHGYMINHKGAKYLLDNILPTKLPIDMSMAILFKKDKSKGVYIFNDKVTIDGIKLSSHKKQNGKKCEFEGIIYQNQEEYKSTIT